MKKYLLWCIIPFFAVGCSVDDEDLVNSEHSLMDLNATFVSSGCVITTFKYSTLGTIEVRNDRDSLYLTITANEGNSISATSLDIANSFNAFPLVGKGNLQPNKMEYQLIFEAYVQEHSFSFPLDELNDNFVIASFTTFNGLESAWAGDVPVKQGNWSYLNYQVKEHPFNAGPDASREMTLSEAKALPSWDEVRKVYAGMLASGVDRKSGTYSPSIWEIINDFNNPERESQLGDYTTTYTLGTGDCKDSTVLTLTVVADPEESIY